ncbi:GerMN domain-containing protein [Geomesophilobacter sediminis]|uniref:GerMN domain-containing protein n=1 Tax=Geomesophilobacter sediminis TaxID=2798584 RepID=A0A8J7J9C9_9BACT|nr:GerMN domain-containing protein [Geomesophilobacter sediminis]MBJ6726461.1 GerMN domain-containing protein [Geomesophilobacter sediminis]
MVRRKIKKAKGMLGFAFVLLALVLGALVARKYETAQRKVEQAPPVQPAGTRVVSLYFQAADASGLVREGREIEIGDSVEETMEAVLDELISGPVGGLAPTLPPQTRVLGVQLKGDVAEINFGHELQDELPAGSSAETTVVTSVADTVAANFPTVKEVQFLVEGAVPETLKGHVDLRHPIKPDFANTK